MYASIAIYTSGRVSWMMKTRGKTLVLATMTIASLFLGLSAVSPVFAHYVTNCTVEGGLTVNVPSGGSTVVKIDVTYASFSPGDWPMTATISPISSGFSSSTDSFSDSSSGTHTFSVTITNTITADTSGSGTVTLKWDDGSSYTCGTLTLKTFKGPPTGAPEFPLGMAVLLALAIPGLLLVRSKFASKFSAPLRAV
jgi:hypothetical protein